MQPLPLSAQKTGQADYRWHMLAQDKPLKPINNKTRLPYLRIAVSKWHKNK